MRGERGMSDVVETTSNEDGGAQGGSARARGADRGEKEGNAKRSGRAQGADGGAQGADGGAQGAIILLFHRGRTPRWR